VTQTIPTIQTIENLAHHAVPAAELLAAMGNPKRLEVLCNLVQGEVSVGDLAERVGLSSAAMSQHLTRLRAQRLVTTRREGQTIYYSSSNVRVRQVLRTLGVLYAKGR
jgi:DNA-binding transcriptional ArsR family regulator